MFYQESKTAKAAVIGTIMPWTGPISNIPKGWILCDGSTIPAINYPLLVQAIGDTYNAGSSTLGGQFPDYTGNFVLPNLNTKTLIDIEEDYFGNTANGGTGKTIDVDSTARDIVTPLIGDNSDNGVTVIFNDVYTDVIFTLNDRTGYAGKITGNTIIKGEGTETVYIGGRKLGVSHVRSHTHSGSYETLFNGDPVKPGTGVVPYANINMTFNMEINDDDLQVPFQPDWGAGYYGTFTLTESSWSVVENRSGAGSGQTGRTLARVGSENPPYNLIPQGVIRTPISNALTNPTLVSQASVPYGLGGGNVTIPQGYRNYYNDSEYSSLGNFGTLVSNTASSWSDASLLAHGHDEIEITYDTNNLKPQSTLNSSVNIPANTVLDNSLNVAALQIDMNISQPSLTCLYIIRAY